MIIAEHSIGEERHRNEACPQQIVDTWMVLHANSLAYAQWQWATCSSAEVRQLEL